MTLNLHRLCQLLIVLLFGLISACGGNGPVAPMQPSDTQVSQPPSVSLTESPINTATAKTPPTALPTIAPTQPTYIEPVVLAEIEATGSAVTDNYQLPACNKAVFKWNVASTSSGTGSLILKIFSPESADGDTIVNEFAMDLGTSGLSGSALYPLQGGEYYFSSENTDQTWTLQIECQDGTAPVAEGIDIEATGNIVTANYTLPACRKSIFEWSAAPSSSGTAALILKLCGNRCVTIVNEFKMDLSQDMTGQSLEAVDGGIYYLVSENTGERSWTVHWTCGD